MFTGLVEDVGTVRAIRPAGGGYRVQVRTALEAGGIRVGDSVATDGICLTAEVVGPDTYEVVAGQETVARTTLPDWRPGRRVNVERALRVGDRLGGHLVQGHVDGVGEIRGVQASQETVVIWVEAPPDLSRYLVEKGSVALDGVSLTVNEVREHRFRVNVIPHTLRATRLAGVGAGERVNLEVDLLARYVERLLKPPGGGGLDLDRLRENGFL